MRVFGSTSLGFFPGGMTLLPLFTLFSLYPLPWFLSNTSLPSSAILPCFPFRSSPITLSPLFSPCAPLPYLETCKSYAIVPYTISVPRLSTRTMASNEARPTVALNLQIRLDDKVARHFRSHELKAGNRDQWVHGKVIGFKRDAKKGKRSEATWWTLQFDPPAMKPLSCHTE
jgi:hypothetical protein